MRSRLISILNKLANAQQPQVVDGACCIKGVCRDPIGMNEDDCRGLGGVFYPNKSCREVDCNTPPKITKATSEDHNALGQLQTPDIVGTPGTPDCDECKRLLDNNPFKECNLVNDLCCRKFQFGSNVLQQYLDRLEACIGACADIDSTIRKQYKRFLKFFQKLKDAGKEVGKCYAPTPGFPFPRMRCRNMSRCGCENIRDTYDAPVRWSPGKCPEE